MNAVDPRVVRQLATEHILDHARRGADVAADVMGHFGPGALERDAFDTWCEAIREAIKTATLIVGWPDGQRPLTTAELSELAASIEHLSGPDAWDEGRLEPALIPVTHYVPRLLAEFQATRVATAADPFATATCRVCGCTDDRACAGGCSWVPDPWQHGDLCSSCLPADPAQWLEPPQDLTEFEIDAMHATDDRPVYVRVSHVPCQTIVFGLPDDPDHLDVDDLLERVATHQCDHVAEPRDVSQIIDVDVDVDGTTVTAAIHGSRPLNAEEQQAMGEIVRAASRLERQREQDKRRQAEEDVRVVDRLLRTLRTHPSAGALKATTRLEEQFADRIAELRQRDAKGPVSVE